MRQFRGAGEGKRVFAEGKFTAPCLLLARKRLLVVSFEGSEREVNFSEGGLCS